jgi:DNA polymerase eta
LERYPYIANVPSDAPMGADSPLPSPPPVDWEVKGTVVPVHPPPPETKTDGQEEGKQTEASPSLNEEPGLFELHFEDDDATTWHDVALSIASELMMKARQEVLTRLGYSTSAVSSFFRVLSEDELTRVTYRVFLGTSFSRSLLLRTVNRTGRVY